MTEAVECIIVNSKGEFLLQKKTLDYKGWPGGPWCFFGGAIEKNEKPLEAIKRELKEELGINIKNLKFLKIRELNSPIHGKMKSYLFLGLFKKEINKIHLNEGAGFAFFDKIELESINLVSSCKNDIINYLNNL